MTDSIELTIEDHEAIIAAMLATRESEEYKQLMAEWQKLMEQSSSLHQQQVDMYQKASCGPDQKIHEYIMKQRDRTIAIANGYSDKANKLVDDAVERTISLRVLVRQAEEATERAANDSNPDPNIIRSPREATAYILANCTRKTD